MHVPAWVMWKPGREGVVWGVRARAQVVRTRVPVLVMLARHHALSHPCPDLPFEPLNHVKPP